MQKCAFFPFENPKTKVKVTFFMFRASFQKNVMMVAVLGDFLT